MTDEATNIDPYRAYKARQDMIGQGLASEKEPLLCLSVQAAEAAVSSAAQWEREKGAESAAAPARTEAAKRAEYEWLRQWVAGKAERRREQRERLFNSLRDDWWGWLILGVFIGGGALMVVAAIGLEVKDGVCAVLPGNKPDICITTQRESRGCGRHGCGDEPDGDENYRSD